MVEKNIYPTGLNELRSVRRESRILFLIVGLFSVFVNLLMLTGPLFMLQVYDRVLGSRSEETLTALMVLVVVLYVLMGVLDWARGRVLGRVAARFQSRLDERVFDAVLKSAKIPDQQGVPKTGLRDLSYVQRFLSSPALFAICDIPWTPIFAAAIFLFHPWLGILAMSGGALLIAVTVINQLVTKKGVIESQQQASIADHFAEAVREDAESVEGLGMRDAVLSRWKKSRDAALQSSISSSDLTGFFTSFSKSFRLLLQSAMLGLGAYLVLQGEMTPGAMIAGSILMGRALAPIELAIGQWPLVLQAKDGWHNLSRLLQTVPVQTARTILPVPKAMLEAKNLTVFPPGEREPSLRMVSFRVLPGQAMGVIGPSAAGKSSLARVITGIWPPSSGKIRLDSAALDQYEPDTLGQYIGYLPQNVTLFNATIAENIARMSVAPDDAKVIEAAQKAGAHEMILQQPDGYNTMLSAFGGKLSGGQRQRLGLARALYGDPVMLVLDEPNSNLDSVGSDALNNAIREMKKNGKSVIIMAHRPAAIAECDTLLILEGGVPKAFGPRDEVLKANVQNADQIAKGLTRPKPKAAQPPQRPREYKKIKPMILSDALNKEPKDE
ncbi:protease/lipase ABC transporter permease/ATP-binding protein [Amylibacter kogurei]|uniref:Protease/lipase ABC transporter permease/ATP-binding protein n=1 Tax=Paramylibacter kogurei TaxID=1889778 RepID=A0A2G5K1J7_9RHOB|nr:type I secretion system permease/ATPase [Amylibacter kogurei]PIB22892.1 protease/lipase ABC transporter permease/ATP-binding protein [Amylibacter kogurei]